MRLTLLTFLLFTAALPCLAQVEFVQQKDQTLVRINGQDFTALRFGKEAHKPYLYPLRTASGKIVTRGFPDNPQPGEDTGAPHQMGVWVGHESVSGVDYFEVDPRGLKNRPTGSIAFKDVTASVGGAKDGVLAFLDEWVHPEGYVVITERRAFRFYAEPKDSRMVDVEFRLHANRKIEMADHKDAVLGLRLGAAFEDRNRAKVRNFVGQEGPAALDGVRSLWIGYDAVVNNEPVGVTIMDHPANYNFPTRWRVDPRGFVFASAFAESSFYRTGSVVPPTAHNMGVALNVGDELVFRYRILIHPPGIDRQSAWLRFAQSPASNLTAPDGATVLQ